MADLSFLKGFEKELEDDGIESGASLPPRYWFSSGNFVVNKTMSGSFIKGILAQGRVTGLCGPSQSGKSFVLCNAMREAQKAGAYVLALDSENALDDEFVSKIGVDTENNYRCIPVDTIPEVVQRVSSFITKYKAQYDRDDPDAPKILIALDSLDMLSTETEIEQFNKGETKGDQGQRNRQLKKMLRLFVQAIKGYNISIVVTAQVYQNQNVLNGEGVWIIADAIKYSLSQILLLTKLKLRVGTGAERSITGIEMKVEAYKTRFTKPFQTVKIEVPYETGMDPYNGLLDVAVAMGVLGKGGSWFTYGEDKFQAKDFPDSNFKGDILVKCEANCDKFLEANLNDVDEVLEDQPTSKKKREKKAKKE